MHTFLSATSNQFASIVFLFHNERCRAVSGGASLVKLKLGVPSAIFRANWVWSRRFYRLVLLASLFVPSLLTIDSLPR